MATSISSHTGIAIFCFAALFATLAPFVSGVVAPGNPSPATFHGWPSHFQGRPLRPLPLTPRERQFARQFPGHIGRFSDGQREIIIRWVNRPTRRLHPAADCFRGIGYAVTPLAIGHSPQGTPMGCMTATQGAERLKVCEYLEDSNGNSWSDISSWYWDASLGSDNDGWYSYVIAERLMN
jgi:hypothetical protein